MTAALAGVLGWFLRAWPPHEDEALALFVGRGSLGHVLRTVLFERGGAPLHFDFRVGGRAPRRRADRLRMVSLVFAVASVPLIALLGRAPCDPATGVVAALLASGTWALLFHGIYGRMYSLFLFTSLLSFLALLSALDTGGRRRFALWGVAAPRDAREPSVRRARRRGTGPVHPAASSPCARSGLDARGRGRCRRSRSGGPTSSCGTASTSGSAEAGRARLPRPRFCTTSGGSPATSARAITPGRRPVLAPCAGRRDSACGAAAARSSFSFACVIAMPALAFMLATLNSTASPEARHLIFALPFFSILLAVPLVELGAPWSAAGGRSCARRRRRAPDRRGALGARENAAALRRRSRRARRSHATAAGAWLAATHRSSDVLLGYEPVYLRAWEQQPLLLRSRAAARRSGPARLDR